MVSNRNKIALINHKIFHVGDKVQGMRIQKIAFNGVELQDEKHTLYLHTNSF
jgi:hypothetical protein